MRFWPFTRSEQTPNEDRSLAQLRNDVAELREELEKWLERERRRSARVRMAAKREVEAGEVADEGVPQGTAVKLAPERRGGLLRRA